MGWIGESSNWGGILAGLQPLGVDKCIGLFATVENLLPDGDPAIQG